MSDTTIKFLQHILHEIDFILDETKKMEYVDLVESEKDQKAITRSFEIIGEAVKNLPEELRSKYPMPDWKRAAGMRDRIIHAYFDVDYQILWSTIETKLPASKLK